jgi:hypothetical protein
MEAEETPVAAEADPKAQKKWPRLNNCLIVAREGDDPAELFSRSADGEHVDCYLDQYAIIPIEMFEVMKASFDQAMATLN